MKLTRLNDIVKTRQNKSNWQKLSQKCPKAIPSWLRVVRMLSQNCPRFVSNVSQFCLKVLDLRVAFIKNMHKRDDYSHLYRYSLKSRSSLSKSSWTSSKEIATIILFTLSWATTNCSSGFTPP